MKGFRNWLVLFMLFSILACGRKKPVELPRQEMAERLLREADSLMRADSAFWLHPVNREEPVMCRYDSLVRQKLDDALLMCPSLKKAYLTKYVYLIRSWKLDEMLQLLRTMGANVPDSMAADMWNLKAMLEDRAGWHDTARHDFLKADSIYGMQLQEAMETKADTTQYTVLRLMKSLNLSLLYNDFTLLRYELNLYNGVYETLPEGIEMLKDCRSKEQYYRYVFGE